MRAKINITGDCFSCKVVQANLEQSEKQLQAAHLHCIASVLLRCPSHWRFQLFTTLPNCCLCLHKQHMMSA